MGWMGGKRRPRVTPLMRCGQASERGTTQLQFSSGQTPNIHLPPFKFPPAKNADSLVIERIPIPERIAYAQNRESIVEIEVSDHYNEHSAHCIKAHNRSIGWLCDQTKPYNPL